MVQLGSQNYAWLCGAGAGVQAIITTDVQYATTTQTCISRASPTLGAICPTAHQLCLMLDAH